MFEDTALPTDGTEELLTIDEATKFLDTSKSTLYRVLSQGDLKGVKVGKQWRFRRADLTAYLQRGPVAAAAAPRADLDAELEFFAEELFAAGAALDDPAALTPDPTAEAKTNELVQRILRLGITAQASDIHLEPLGDTLRLRLRIDGVLHEIRRMPMTLHEALLTRVKEMAEMNLIEKRVPQDGRILIRREGKDYDLRMSVLPTSFGENAVLRILDRNSVLLGLDNLGIEDHALKAIRQWVHKPNGMVIATGPTGSGKTTLLYSGLREINSDEKKVITIEDPVECFLPGVTQSAVNKRAGLTFAAALRSFLRQDPDVILAGELRDQEAALLVVEAALTGHLVLTSLHTEDAPSALVRLADMGVERYLVAGTVNGVIALRLARRLCPQCKTLADPDEIAPTLEKVAPLAAVGGYRLPGDAVYYAAAGCAECRQTGYHGRMGLFETLPCTPKLVEQLLACDAPNEMTRIAVQHGMRTLLADGLQKAAAGLTTIEEVLRAAAVWL